MAYTQDELKQQVAKAAVEYVKSGIIGVGTGSTANFFIEELAKVKHKIDGAVASSEATAARLRGHGIEVFDLNSVDSLDIYVDGADEITEHMHMLKGGGGALTREKIVAAVAKQFICICDSTKQVDLLGKFPLPIEVIPMAWAQIKRELEKLGGQVNLRLKKDGSEQALVTDNQGWILDVSGLQIKNPAELESTINQIPGVICNGIFARRKADILLVGSSEGVKRLVY